MFYLIIDSLFFLPLCIGPSSVHSLRLPRVDKPELLIGCETGVIQMNIRGIPAFGELELVPFTDAQDKLTCMVASGIEVRILNIKLHVI